MRYRRLQLTVNTRQKTLFLQGARHDAFCRQTLEVCQPLKQTVEPKVSCLYVFDQHIPLSLRAYFSLRNSTLASKIILNVYKNLAKNIFLSENKSSRQQPPTPNFECLAAKRVMFASIYNMFFPHVYILRCNQQQQFWFNFSLVALSIWEQARRSKSIVLNSSSYFWP